MATGNTFPRRSSIGDPACPGRRAAGEPGDRERGVAGPTRADQRQPAGWRYLPAPGRAGERRAPPSFFPEDTAIVRGRLGVRLGGRELQADPGTRVQVAPGVAHDFWNAGSQEAHVILEVQPAQRFLLAIRQLVMLAQDGKTDAKGRPRPLDAAVVAREFSDTFRFTSPPAGPAAAVRAAAIAGPPATAA